MLCMRPSVDAAFPSHSSPEKELCISADLPLSPPPPAVRPIARPRLMRVMMHQRAQDQLDLA